jgi:hypothetical protein
MRIGLLETVPILREKLKSERILYPFGGKLVVESVRYDARYDLILSDKKHFHHLPYRASVFLIPGNSDSLAVPNQGILLTGGMSHSDSVSFSSIRETEAMLCVQQEICMGGRSIEPFEKKVVFNRNFSLYKNLATGFALSLAEILFTEEL